MRRRSHLAITLVALLMVGTSIVSSSPRDPAQAADPLSDAIAQQKALRDTLAEQRVTLRSPDGAFLEKAFVDKRGNVVAGVKVLEELKDAATGLSFPKAWERTGPQGRFKVALDGATVNGGLAKEQFSVAVPDGYRAGT